jgi:hypothetical protein
MAVSAVPAQGLRVLLDAAVSRVATFASWSYAAPSLRAKVGANVGRSQASSGVVRRLSSQVRAM